MRTDEYQPSGHPCEGLIAIAGDLHAVSGHSKMLPDDVVSRLSYIDEVQRKHVTPQQWLQPLDMNVVNAWWNHVGGGASHRQMRRADWTAMWYDGPKTKDPNDWYTKQNWYWNQLNKDQRQNLRGKYISLGFWSDAGKVATDVLKNPITGIALTAVLTPLLGPGVLALGPLVLGAGSKLMSAAKLGNPKALGFVADVVKKASGGDTGSKQLVDLFKTLQTPASTAAAAKSPADYLSALSSVAGGSYTVPY